MSKYLGKRNDAYHFCVGTAADVRSYFNDRWHNHAFLKIS